MAQGGAVGELMARLGEAPQPGGLRDALADALDDPSLELVYWLPEGRRYVDCRGREYELPGGRPERERCTTSSATGDCVAAIIYDATLRDAERARPAPSAPPPRSRSRTSASTRSCARRSTSCARSRERMLRIGLEERRRLERDLHDGAQQRLVSHGAQHPARAREAERGPARGRPAARRAPARSWTPRSRSCASSRAASTRRC